MDVPYGSVSSLMPQGLRGPAGWAAPGARVGKPFLEAADQGEGTRCLGPCSSGRSLWAALGGDLTAGELGTAAAGRLSRVGVV